MEQQQSQAARPPTDHETQAAASLKHFFDAQVAEAMPKAYRAALRDAFTISRFLVNGTMRVQPALFGVLAETELPMLRSLSVPTLLVLLFDKRQPAEITAAVRDAIEALYLADEQTMTVVIGAARRMARNAVQDLQHDKAEHKALFGRVGASVTAEQCAAVDETAGIHSLARARVLDASEC
jgi:hypothetical protein